MSSASTFTRTSPKRAESRFSFAQPDSSSENTPALANVANVTADAVAPKPQLRAPTVVRQTGIVSRLVGQTPTPKYGFIQTENGENIFFHYKTLSIETMACVERGSEVEFEVSPNPFSDNRPMATNVSIKDAENKYADSQGELTKWLPDKGFGFITTPDGKTYFAHTKSFIMNDSATAAAMRSLNSGEVSTSDGTREVQVVFDKSVNYKSSPPKPFALNIRVVGVSEKRDPALTPSAGAWRSPRTMLNRTSSSSSNRRESLSDITLGTSPRNSRDSSSSWRSSGSSSWRSSANKNESPRSTLFQKYNPKAASSLGTASAGIVAPPPGFSARDCCFSNTAAAQSKGRSWRSPPVAAF